VEEGLCVSLFLLVALVCVCVCPFSLDAVFSIAVLRDEEDVCGAALESGREPSSLTHTHDGDRDDRDDRADLGGSVGS
jgi:hypothetical protein